MTESSEGVAVVGYLAVMLRWKWLIIGATLVCIAAGFVYLKTRTPMYSATTKLLYVQPVTISNPLVQGSYNQAYQQPDIGTVSAMVGSIQVAGAAARQLSEGDKAAGYFVKATQPADTTGGTSATVVGIEADSPDPNTAARAANATAQAFVEWRRDTSRAQVQDGLNAVNAALKAYRGSTNSADYLQLRQSQQALELQLESLQSDFTIIGPATVPDAPYSPRNRHTLVLAAILGLALGMGLAFLLEQVDTRVRDEREMAEALDLSVLGHLPALARRGPEGASVQMLANPSGPMAEAIRVLRGNLSFTGVDGDVRSVIITSSVRTEGKSVTASNLAVSMALAGQRVLLVDADFRRPRIHTYMRISNAIGLSSVLARRADLSEAIVPVSLAVAETQYVTEPMARENVAVRVMSLAGKGHGRDQSPPARPMRPGGSREEPVLRVLPSGPLPPNPGEMAASQRFGEIVRSLADEADLVVIDTPPLIEVGDTAAMAAKVDGLVFVANLNKIKWPMIERAKAQLEKFPCRKLGLVVVASRSAHKSAYGYDYRANSIPRVLP